MTASSRTQCATQLVLARHGRTPLNVDGRLRGRLDPALDAEGQREAVALARALYPLRPVMVITSPLLRARQTAAAICQRYLVPVTVDDRLIDRDYGPWTGQRERDVLERWGSPDDAPGVEPAFSVAQRAMALLDEQREAHPEGVTVLVSHDAVNRAVLARLLCGGEPHLISQRTACWNVLALERGRWRVVELDQKASA